MHAKVHAVVVRLNIARPVCGILLGHKARPSHRMAVGAIVMSFGVVIAKASQGVHFEILSMAVDGLGYAIHALGTAPFIEWMSDLVKQEEHRHD